MPTYCYKDKDGQYCAEWLFPSGKQPKTVKLTVPSDILHQGLGCPVETKILYLSFYETLKSRFEGSWIVQKLRPRFWLGKLVLFRARNDRAALRRRISTRKASINGE